jgi:hypothetical protein
LLGATREIGRVWRLVSRHFDPIRGLFLSTKCDLGQVVAHSPVLVDGDVVESG